MTPNFETSSELHHIITKLEDEQQNVHDLEQEEARLATIISVLLKPESERTYDECKLIDIYKYRAGQISILKRLNEQPSKGIADIVAINHTSDNINRCNDSIDEITRGDKA